jgi:hypothetical protein
VAHKKRCPSGKHVHLKRELRGMASGLARDLNARGELAPSFYGYRCPLCHAWHLTKLETYKGARNELVHRAAPEALQRWAMTGEMPERLRD